MSEGGRESLAGFTLGSKTALITREKNSLSDEDGSHVNLFY